MSNRKFTRVLDNVGFKQTLWYALIIAVGWGLLRMTITHCLPRLMPLISFIVGILFLLFFGITSLATSIVSKVLGNWTIPFAVILIILAIILLVMVCAYSNEIKFQGYMLEYAVKSLNENPHGFLYIPVFIIFHIGLAALIFWQHSCFSSYYFGSGNFWNLASSGLFDILNIL